VNSIDKLLGIEEIKLSAYRPSFSKWPKPKFTDIEILTASDTGQTGKLRVRLTKTLPYRVYEIVDGESSWFLAQEAGIRDIWVELVDMTDAEHQAAVKAETSIDPAISLKDPMAYAEKLAERVKAIGTLRDAAVVLQQSKSHIHRQIRLLDLPSSIQELIRSEELDVAAGYILCKERRVNRAIELAEKVRNSAVDKKSVRWLEKQIKRPTPTSNNRTDSNQAEHDEWLSRLSNLITDAVSHQALVSQNIETKAGEITFKFNDNDEFEGLLERLAIKIDL